MSTATKEMKLFCIQSRETKSNNHLPRFFDGSPKLRFTGFLLQSTPKHILQTMQKEVWSCFCKRHVSHVCDMFYLRCTSCFLSRFKFCNKRPRFTFVNCFTFVLQFQLPSWPKTLQNQTNKTKILTQRQTATNRTTPAPLLPLPLQPLRPPPLTLPRLGPLRPPPLTLPRLGWSGQKGTQEERGA